MAKTLNPPPSPWSLRLAAPAVIILTAVLLLLNLGAFPLGNDEAAYARRAMGTWGDLRDWIARDNIPPLFPSMMKVWGGIAGFSPVSLRLPAVVFALLLLACYLPLLQRKFPAHVAWTAFLLLAFSPLHLFLSRVSKYFSLLALLVFGVVALTWYLAEETRGRPLRNHRAGVVAWGLGLLLTLWVHYLGAVLWLVVGGWLLGRWWLTREGRHGRLLGIQALFFIGFLPWMPILLARLGAMGSAADPVVAESPVRMFVAQVGYTFYAFAVGQTLEPSRLILAGFGALAFLGVLAFAIGRATLLARHSLLHRFLLWHVLLLLLGGFLLLRVFVPGHPALSLGERLAFVLPLLLILVAEGWYALPRLPRVLVVVAWVPAAVVSNMNIILVRENVQWEYLIPWEEMKAMVEQEGEGGGTKAVVSDSWHMGSRGWYYLRDSGDDFFELRGIGEAGEVDALAARLREEYQTVWFVRSTRDTSPGRWSEELSAHLEEAYPEQEVWGFVEDSPRLRRLKELFRRGSGTETHTAKVRLERYDSASGELE